MQTSENPERTNPPKDTGRAGTFVGQLLDRILGFDFFISYAHADIPEYAEQLVALLRSRGFKAFLDKEVYVAGDELHTATPRRIKASSKLVVLVGPQALNSNWVLQEVEAAIRANRPVIAIDLVGDLSNRAGSGLAKLLRDRIHIREPGGLAAKAPSEKTLEALTRSFQATRREALRLRLAFAATLFFAVLAGFSYWQKNLADDRADQYLNLCEKVVQQVTTGQKKIDDLRLSRFGELIANITDTLAQLPDPATDPDLSCIPVGS